MTPHDCKNPILADCHCQKIPPRNPTAVDILKEELARLKKHCDEAGDDISRHSASLALANKRFFQLATNIRDIEDGIRKLTV